MKKVIVVGGGIIGLSIAYNLAKNGVKVVILEKGILGREASWAAAGMLRPQSEFENESLLRLSLDSIKLYPLFTEELKEHTEIDINYKTEGTIILAYTSEEFAELKERYESQKKLGLDVMLLTKKSLLELEPYISDNFIGAVLIKGDHWVDNRLMISALCKAIKKYNVDVYENCIVSSYIEKANRVIGVESSLGSFYGDYVVNSAGSWAGDMRANNPKVIPPVKPVLGQLLEIKSPDWLIRHNVCTYSTYLASKDKNKILVGSTMEDVGFNKRVSVSGVEFLTRNAIKLVPKISECEFLSVWAGFRPTSPDRLPILGTTLLDRLIIATGTYRNGILLAPIIGTLICEVIIKGREPKSILPFKIGRFYR